MKENHCVDYCLRRVGIDGHEAHLHASPHGPFVNIWGPYLDDEDADLILTTTHSTLAAAEAEFDQTVREYLDATA